MKMPARVTVTAGRKGGASAVSRGWRWRLSRSAGEEEESDVINTSRPIILLTSHTQVNFKQGWKKYSQLYFSKSTCATL